MRQIIFLPVITIVALTSVSLYAAEPAQIVEVKKIWDRAPHNAFTDLVRYKNRWFCVFREGKGHASPDGALRVLESRDGVKWKSAALIRVAAKCLNDLRPKVLAKGTYMDLRDPRICITPDGRLMLNSAIHYNDRRDWQSLAWFSKDGKNWGKGVLIGEHQYWLWRVTWNKGHAYASGRIEHKRVPRLYKSTDGKHFKVLVKDDFFPYVPGPSEATLRFLADDTAYCFIRLNNVPGSKTGNAHLGIARPPYTKWKWKDLGQRVGGPNMIQLPDGRFVAAVRFYDRKVRTALCWLDPKAGTLKEFLALPSGGDTSYAGLVHHDGLLWVSYYSSHEGKTSIYLAKVQLPAASAGASGLKAVSRQMVRPVLIRNEHNSLLRLTINAKKPFVQIKSIKVSVDGANELESLQFYSTGSKLGLSSEKPFGERLRAKKTMVFRGHARLNTGANHFWLSCRVLANANLTKKVDASIVAIETTAGRIMPRDQTPNVHRRIGIALRRHWDDGVHTYRIPVLATTPKGTLLAVYDMRRRKGKDLQEDIDIGLLRSTDGGRTWGAQQVIMDMGTYNGKRQEINGCSDPGIIVDPETGEIFCFAVWMHGMVGRHQWNKGGSVPGFEIGKAAQFMMVRSKDDGQNWTKPKNMTRTWKNPKWILYAPAPQQGIALKDGTLVMPTQGRDANDRHFSNLLISRNHGKTWTVSGPASFGNTECQAVQLADGSIMLNCRTESPTKYRTVAVTRDLGKTWMPHPTNRKTLIEPNCNGSTYRFDYRDGGKTKSVILFANPHSQKGRTHHSIEVSFDEGKTWPKKYRLLLDEGRGAGYPSLSRVDDRHVGIVYEGSGSHLVFEKIPIDELLKR